ncbi:hypothetical protein EPN87_03730 [archaeon]|nr:MAG: hypothetical protein EPN87_03730 [archaeon]
MTIWAWRPFAVGEKYKASREQMDYIDASAAGFSELEIKQLIDAKLLGGRNERSVYGLPQEPSIDRIVRFYYKNWGGPDKNIKNIGALENHYKVKFNVKDLFNARQMLVEQFRHSLTGLSPVAPWTWSPYYIFLQIPWGRSVFRTPDGAEAEDLELETFTTSTYSQNLIIVRCLELIAKNKVQENYINSLLGEYGVSPEQLKGFEELEEIEELIKEDYPGVFGKKEKTEKGIEQEKKMATQFASSIKMAQQFRHVRKTVGDSFKKVGLGMNLFRAVGPYEFSMQNRMAKQMQREPGGQFLMIKDFLKTKFEVPGVNVTW